MFLVHLGDLATVPVVPDMPVTLSSDDCRECIKRTSYDPGDQRIYFGGENSWVLQGDHWQEHSV